MKDTTAVGSYPQGASSYGCLDMAGNVWEWTADWYDRGYYQISPERDPIGLKSGDGRVLRGGSWFNDPYYMRAAFRLSNLPDLWNSYVGFRVWLSLSSDTLL